MMEMKKILVVGIIFLFIGVAIAPSINFTVVKASNDNDLVEVTTQACGIKGFGNTTVKLTRQQTSEVDQLFDSINSKLNNATSREESIRIYHEAIIELDRYGLLPQGMSVEKAQRLVTGCNQNRYERLLNNRLRQEFSPLFINVFCLLSINATRNPNEDLPMIIPLGPLFFICLPLATMLEKVGGPYLGLLIFAFMYHFPLRLMNLIFIFGYYTDFHSFGLKGAVDSNDVFILLGYTGLTLNFVHKVYFLGFALGAF